MIISSSNFFHVQYVDRSNMANVQFLSITKNFYIHVLPYKNKWSKVHVNLQQIDDTLAGI